MSRAKWIGAYGWRSDVGFLLDSRVAFARMCFRVVPANESRSLTPVFRLRTVCHGC